MEIPLRLNGYLFKNAFVSPNVAIVKQGDFYQVNAGAYLGLDFMFAGVSYRHTINNNSDAAIATLGFRQGDLKIGYSYDVTVSGIPSGSGGSHELSLVYILNTPVESKYNDCFGLFR